jgi:hypothetical protein
MRPVDQDEGILEILPLTRRPLWLSVLGESLEEIIDPPSDWFGLAQKLFKFERDLRIQLKGAFYNLHGDQWASILLLDHQEQIIHFARRDTTPLVAGLSDVRSPLDWITLTQLLDLAADVADSGSDRIVGHTAAEWRELSAIVIPVRNRIGHMRLVREGDKDSVRRATQTFHMRVRAEAARVVASKNNASRSPQDSLTPKLGTL